MTKTLVNKPNIQQPDSVSSHNYDTHVSQLDNGLKIASEKLFGEFCTVGGNIFKIIIIKFIFKEKIFLVIIDSGPRYETPFINGTTHFLEKLAFNVNFFKC